MHLLLLLQGKTVVLANALRNCISLSRSWHVMNEESENLLKWRELAM